MRSLNMKILLSWGRNWCCCCCCVKI